MCIMFKNFGTCLHYRVKHSFQLAIVDVNKKDRQRSKGWGLPRIQNELTSGLVAEPSKDANIYETL